MTNWEIFKDLRKLPLQIRRELAPMQHNRRRCFRERESKKMTENTKASQTEVVCS
jgi:hypothetical protein